MLDRSGHTEAGVDLATLAGLEPAGVLAEVVNDDGTVKRLPELIAFAREHKPQDHLDRGPDRLPAAARDRSSSASPWCRRRSAGLNAEAYVYETPFDPLQQVALVIGDVDGKENVPVRIYREQPLRDLLGRANGDGDLMEKAVAEIKARGRAGVMIVLRASRTRSSPPRTTRRRRSGSKHPRGERHDSARSSACSAGARSGSARRSCATSASARSR